MITVFTFYYQEGVDYDGSASGSVEDLTFPNRLIEGAPDATNHRLDPSLEATEGTSD